MRCEIREESTECEQGDTRRYSGNSEEVTTITTTDILYIDIMCEQGISKKWNNKHNREVSLVESTNGDLSVVVTQSHHEEQKIVPDAIQFGHNREDANSDNGSKRKQAKATPGEILWVVASKLIEEAYQQIFEAASKSNEKAIVKADSKGKQRQSQVNVAAQEEENVGILEWS